MHTVAGVRLNKAFHSFSIGSRSQRVDFDHHSDPKLVGYVHHIVMITPGIVDSKHSDLSQTDLIAGA